ncbi:hypothetical protein ACFLVP_04025 [Chloroflexota bacterium]
MEMNEDNVNALRNMFNTPNDGVLTIWNIPGWRSCPLPTGENAPVNCPLGFDHSGVPDKPEPWMRWDDDDGSEKAFWLEILTRCRDCRGIPAPSDDERMEINGICRSLFKGRTS